MADKTFFNEESTITQQTAPVRAEGYRQPLGAQAIRYALIGVIFGLMFPIGATLIKLAQLHLSLNLPDITTVQGGDSLLWIIDSAPLILGLFAGYAGRRQDILLEANRKLLEREEELKQIQADLGRRVVERTAELEIKSNQLRSSYYIVGQIVELQEVPGLLSKVVQLISEQFGFYYVGIFLLDDQRRIASLQAASPGAGQKLLERGYHTEAGDDSVIGRVIERRKFQILTDVGTSAQIMRSPELQHTRSELALPLVVRGKVIGVLDIQSDKPHAFGSDDAEILQSLSDQLATSIDNVRLLNETQAVVGQLEALTSRQTRMSWQDHLKQRNSAYQFTPAGIKQTTAGTLTKNKSALRIPLQLRGQEIGTITVQRQEASGWQDAERELAEKIATQVALALDNSRLIEESRRRAVQEQTVSEISARLSRSLDIESLLQTAVRELSALPEVAEVSVYIGEPDEKK